MTSLWDKIIKQSIAGMAVLALLGACSENASIPNPQASDQKAEKPINVVMIIGDDHGWPYYGFLGDENVVTPNLDRLASEGTVFTIGHSASNHCRPTLQSLITGLLPVQYAERTKELTKADLSGDEAYQNATGREKHARYTETEAAQMEHFATVPRVLAESGYASFQGGKWWEQSYETAGFTDGMSGGWSWKKMMDNSGFFQFMGGDGIELGRTTMEPLERFISEKGDQPFFIWYGPALPHVPLNPPAEHRQHYENDKFSESAKDYYGNITWFDTGIGQMLDMLEAKGVLENTMIVYVNDNGWEQPADVEYKDNHDLYSNGGTRGKSSLFDTGFRMPVIVRLPGKIKPQVNNEALVSSVDIVPTILDYAGAIIPEGLPGYSLRPIINGDDFEGRKYLIGYQTQHRGDSNYLGEYLGASGDVMGRKQKAFYLRSQEWHFVWISDTGEMALYDMVNDPGSKNNIVDEHQDLVATFKKEIQAWAAKYVPAEG